MSGKSFAIAWANKYTVFLDNDEEGRTAFITYKNFFEAEEANKWLMYADSESDFKLESFISKSDKENLITLTSAKNIKNAIIKLYFIEESQKKTFFESLSDETNTNLQNFCNKVIEKLNL